MSLLLAVSVSCHSIVTEVDILVAMQLHQEMDGFEAVVKASTAFVRQSADAVGNAKSVLKKTLKQIWEITHQYNTYSDLVKEDLPSLDSLTAMAQDGEGKMAEVVIQWKDAISAAAAWGVC